MSGEDPFHTSYFTKHLTGQLGTGVLGEKTQERTNKETDEVGIREVYSRFYSTKNFEFLCLETRSNVFIGSISVD